MARPLRIERPGGHYHATAQGNAREPKELKRAGRRIGWEQEKGEGCGKFWSRHGDWGRDAALWLGRRCWRLKQAELAALARGIDYAAAGTAVARFGNRLEREQALRQQLEDIQTTLLND